MAKKKKSGGRAKSEFFFFFLENLFSAASRRAVGAASFVLFALSLSRDSSFLCFYVLSTHLVLHQDIFDCRIEKKKLVGKRVQRTKKGEEGVRKKSKSVSAKKKKNSLSPTRFSSLKAAAPLLPSPSFSLPSAPSLFLQLFILVLKMYTQRPLTEQERIDQATMRIDNPNVAIVGSGEEEIDWLPFFASSFRSRPVLRPFLALCSSLRQGNAFSVTGCKGKGDAGGRSSDARSRERRERQKRSSEILMPQNFVDRSPCFKKLIPLFLSNFHSHSLGFIQHPPQRPFERPLQVQPPTVSVS